MELHRRAERQVALIRWAALVVGAVMLIDAMPAARVAEGLALVAAYNAILMCAAACPDRYAKWGRSFGAVVAVLDILCVSAAIGLSRPSVTSLYLLYGLVILGAGYVSMKPRNIALAAVGSVVGHLVATLVANPHAGAAWILRATALHNSELVMAAGLAGSMLIFKRRDDAMLRRDRKLSTLLDFGTRFATGEDAARVMEQTLRAAIRDADATAGYIMLVNEAGDELVTEVAVSVGEERVFPTTRAMGEGMEGYAAETGKPLLVGREQEPAARSGEAPAMKHDAEAALAIPMTDHGPSGTGGVIGVFTLLNHRAGSRFLDEDVDLSRTLAGLATMAIVNSRLHENLRRSFLSSLQALAKTLDAKDPYTQGHSFRVAELCVMMAARLRVAPEVVEDLRNGALLHDVGKIGVPDAILCKPGRLTDEEFEVMKRHPVIGYEICKPLGLGEGILMLIRNHHERLDGTGYPDGLRLGQLPLPLRIICAADAFDAMSSNRPYRQVMDSQIRNEQLNRFAGTQFDPIVIETLKALVSSGALDELYKDHWKSRDEAVAKLDEALPKAA